ncbi:MAG: glycosyltransferase family 2 protein [Bacteroidota bacterium]|nr:glycosyltransferase family 2 protein [Bacteroidota bacterium]
MSNNEIQYSIIVPLYNEELVVNEAYKRLKAVMDYTRESYEIIFVNDGSKDRTVEMTRKICKKDKNIKLLSFSRNFGHQVAITAGMNNSSGNAVIVIDADLQDPPEVMLKMIEKWKQGFDVVYGKRLKRKGETFFKKTTAKLFYRTLKSMTDINMPVDAGDFRLIDRKVCDALKSIPERNRYVRGLISWLGFKQTGVEFIREERFAGETKYPLKKMVKFASDALTSFSYKPLKLATYIGAIISVFSFLYMVFILFEKMFTEFTVQGWTFIVALSLLFNGLMFIMLGIIGEYIGRIYDEAKGRPLYIIDEKEGF